jgi:uncharacterized membrane protein
MRMPSTGRNLAAAFVLTCVTLSAAAGATPDNSGRADIKGIYLTAPYPAVTIAAGDTATIDLKLRNYGLPPQPVTLSISGLPEGWKARFIGNNHPVEAAMPAPGEAIDLQLRIEVPKGAESAAADLVLRAEGADARATLPLKIALGDRLPVRLGFRPELPALRGTRSTAFTFTFDLRNDSGRDLVVSLAADAPPHFQVAFTKQYDSQEISSLPVKAGQSANVSMKVNLPSGTKAGTYKVLARASGGDVTAAVPVALEVVGEPKLELTTRTGRLSGDAAAGAATPIALVLKNTGSAPARNISISGSVPGKWKVEFQPSEIDALAPGAERPVQALLTPGEKAVAGDYMATFTASGEGNAVSADYRVTVTTSTLWGIVGIGIIAVALLAVLGAVARFGRR